ncbi:MAG: hypothetical protein DWB56_03065 [Candidatus Jettenia sp.]|uniref:Uncharacterized protein n=1 Tax=Candidatus Jettenia caeni TaxID=247490 RepID=I3INE4_9BACT|nr:hypothetical protein [Candidatus Jettenia sp. AMX1]MBC6927938.1 hypothetical protein [Candidatus Jettenia sp.]WKZ14918.1 MAG: hypothetical protein QY317_13550 [Candidatus Jettenia caeni]KAA0248257.1 MAG: hypothetical protein EDM77_13195 [Candidatus Jettenia sp. AMX1]MCE7879540.1 hypothetical protein [Candidatus Jettenia sp. AMX1]MDL1937835.1 hypothetical protein [Candidatus Jettenia sp. AMX1]
MLNKKFVGIVASAVLSVSVMVWGSSFSYANEKPHKHKETVPGESETETMESKCPKCELTRVRPIKGRAYHPIQWKMKCPECKKEPKEMLIVHCDECDENFLECPICRAEQKKAKNR